MKTALITGVLGQDGAYLSELLANKGYRVIGAYRRSATPSTDRLEFLNVKGKVELVSLELLEYSNIQNVIEKYQPDEIYNLAAQSFVAESFINPIYTVDVDGLGTLRILEAIRKINPKIKFYQASTSEMFGKVQETPQSESTKFYPRSPYGISKLMSHWFTVNYRESYDMFACSGILFNHESPLRGEEFVTRKITKYISEYLSVLNLEPLQLGNLDAKRDWGFAGDYVEGMWKMLQHNVADDYVLATGETHSIREFIEIAFSCVGIGIYWKGSGDSEIGTNFKGETIIQVNPKFYRPAEVELLIGDNSKAKKTLGWCPKMSFTDLILTMVNADLQK